MAAAVVAAAVVVVTLVMVVEVVAVLVTVVLHWLTGPPVGCRPACCCSRVKSLVTLRMNPAVVTKHGDDSH